MNDDDDDGSCCVREVLCRYVWAQPTQRLFQLLVTLVTEKFVVSVNSLLCMDRMIDPSKPISN